MLRFTFFQTVPETRIVCLWRRNSIRRSAPAGDCVKVKRWVSNLSDDKRGRISVILALRESDDADGIIIWDADERRLLGKFVILRIGSRVLYFVT